MFCGYSGQHRAALRPVLSVSNLGRAGRQRRHILTDPIDRAERRRQRAIYGVMGATCCSTSAKAQYGCWSATVGDLRYRVHLPGRVVRTQFVTGLMRSTWRPPKRGRGLLGDTGGFVDGVAAAVVLRAVRPSRSAAAHVDSFPATRKMVVVS